MSIIFVLIPIAVVLVLIGLGIFFWAVRSKQFDDLDKEAYSILFDNQTKPTTPAQSLPVMTAQADNPQADVEPAVTTQVSSELDTTAVSVSEQPTADLTALQSGKDTAGATSNLDERTSNKHSG